jgi:uncharacterized membrane protein
MPDPLHPLVVHLPLALALLLPALLIAVWIGQARGRWPESVALLVVGLQLLLALGAFAALRTGEAEEELLEDHLPREALHDHEELGERFAWASLGALGFGLLPLLVKPRRLRTWLRGVALIAALAVAGLGVATGKAGGELVWRHDAAGLRLEATGAARPAAAWPAGGNETGDDGH